MVRDFNKRVVSAFLTLVMLLSFCSNVLLSNSLMNAKAIGTFDEDTLDALADAASDIYSAQNWSQATADGCSNDFFHNAVQDYLASKVHGYGFKKEKKINYNQIVINPVTEKETTYGKADIYKQIDSSTYHVWEVKPVSYNNATRKLLAIQQLDNYTNTALHEEQDVTYLKGGLDPPLNTTTSFTKQAPNPKAKYMITFWGTPDGLILYKFQRLPDPEEEEEKVVETSLVPVTTVSFVAVTGAAVSIGLSKARLTSLTEMKPIIDKAVGICTAIIASAPIIVNNSQGVRCYAVSSEDNLAIEACIEQLSWIDITEDDENATEKEIEEKIKEKEEKYREAETQAPQRDPLIIRYTESDDDFLTSLENGVNFDLDNNGFDEKTAWIGEADCFLVLDVDGNKKIDNGSELFGDRFVMPNGNISSTGFEALASLDANGDTFIDKDDLIFPELKVWFDSNHNGKTDSGELRTLSDEHIVSIDLNATPDGTVHIRTEVLEAESSYVTYDDNTTRKISEFWFPINSSDTTHNGVTTVGNVPSLSQALEADDNGYLTSLCNEFSSSNNISTKRFYLKKILYNITGAESIAINSRGDNIDARDLYVIEQFMGREFVGVGGSEPNSLAAEKLKNIYDSIEDLYYNYVNFRSNSFWFRYFTGIDESEDGSLNVDTHYVDKYLLEEIENEANIEVFLYDYGMYLKYLDEKLGTSSYSKFVQKYSTLSVDYANVFGLINTTRTVFGGEENDTISGSEKNDIIFSGNGDDTINAGSGNDFIYGGTGNDTMNGGDGNDSYYIDANHGNDVIRDINGDNKLIFADGLSVEDYEASINAELGFVLTNKETGETVSLPDFITNPLIYNFKFEGGSDTEESITNREVFEGTATDDYIETGDGFNISYGGDGNDTLAGGKDIDFMYGGNGDDLVLGRNGVNVLFGEEGNDTIYDGDHGSYLNGGNGDDMLYGGGGADVLGGGAGDDYLQGDHGNDTYIFGKGYDTDTINASSDVNTIIIKGYSASSMINTRNAHNDLIIHFGSEDSTDCLIVDHFFDYNSNRDIRFEFDNGTVLGQYDITAKYAPIVGTDADEWLAIQNSDDGIIHGNGGNDGVNGGSGNDELYGDSGDDTLYGNDGNDILDGGTGTDGLNGGNGADTYIFAKGYGNDTVNEWGSDHSIIKLTDIKSNEVTVNDLYGSNLLLSIVNTEDTLVISNFKWGQATYTFEFADGAVATVNKDTWAFEFSQLPIVPEEEEVTTSDTTTVTDETTVETEVPLETTEDEEIQSTEESDTSIETENTASEVIIETKETTINDVGESDSADTKEVTEQNDSQEADATENVIEETGSDVINIAEVSVDTDVT